MLTTPLRAWVAPLAAALAVAGLVLASAWRELGVPPSSTFAGEELSRQLDSEQVRIVVLGSSMAASHVNAERLADGLGLPREAVATYAMPHSSSAHWFAAWRARLRGRSPPPDLVLVVGSVGQMLQPRVLAGLDEALYLGELPPDPPAELLRPLGGRAIDLRLAVLRVRLATALEDELYALRRGAAQLAGTPYDVADSIGAGPTAVLLPDLGVVALQSAEVQDQLLAPVLAFQDVAPVAETQLPALLREVASEVPKTVLVRAPTRPDLPRIDSFPPELVAEVAEQARSAGAAWIDLRDLGLPAERFADPVHLDPAGSEVFTDALVARLRNESLAPEPAAP